MRGSAVHVRLRFWSALSLSLVMIVAWGPTAAFAIDAVPLSEQVNQVTDQVSGTGGEAATQAADSAGQATEQAAASGGQATEQAADSAGQAADSAGQVADSAGQVADSAGQVADSAADSAGQATEQAAASGGQATEQVAASGGQATEQVADSGGQATNQVADAAGQATNQVADAAGQATNQVADSGGQATNQVADSVGKATEQITGSAGSTSGQATDTLGQTAAQAAGTVGQTAAQATDTIGQAAEHVTDTAWQTTSSAGSDPLPVIGRQTPLQSTADAAETGIAFTDASTALTVAPAEELASGYQGVLLWDAADTAPNDAAAGFVFAWGQAPQATIGQTAEQVTGTAWQTTSSAGSDPLPVIGRQTALHSTADAAETGIAFTDASTALTVAPAEELASGYQGVLLWDAVVAAARDAGAGFDLAWARVADACGAQCEKTVFGVVERDSFAEEVASLIRFLAITGLQLIGLMWRALAAALVGVFLVSLARRRESQDLLAAGGYSQHWR
jgi:hypothetical protein